MSGVRIQIDLAEPPPLRGTTGSSSLLMDGEGKPRLERSSSRSLNRHNYTRSQSNAAVVNSTTNEFVQLRKSFETLSQNLESKEKEIEDTKSETIKNEQLVQKLNIDLQGAHILIQNLQKEQQQTKEKESSSSSVGSVVMRQQKKIKAYKEQLDSIEAENTELKKLLQSLKKHKKKDPAKS